MSVEQFDWDEDVILEDGTPQNLSSILPQGWCLLILFRHAECMECNLLVHNLNVIQNHFREWDVQLLGVGNSNVDAIRRLRTRLSIAEDVILCAHPERSLHQSLQLHHSFLGAFGAKALWNTVHGFYQGHIQTSITTPMRQQSGIILLNPRKEICWIHRSKYLGDIPSCGELLEQLLIHRAKELV